MCCCSKILERFFVDKLIAEIEERNLIAENQLGFTRGKNTVHAVGRLIELINRHRADLETAGVLSIDLKRAFDSVKHGILINRLRKLGI